jgi:3-hydroxybutyryl-CoA dehydrogenase
MNTTPANTSEKNITTIQAPQAFPLLTLGGKAFVPGKSRVAVLGGGVMGPGITQVFTEAGFEVDLCELNALALEKGLASLKESLQLKVELGLITKELALASLARATGNIGSDDALKRADLVVEAVTENKAIKKEVYARVQQLCKQNTVLWSNTSTLDVFSLAEPGMRERLVVAHWFAPPHIVPLVEVVGDPCTHPGLVDETVLLLKALGKTPVKLNKFVNGFVINRLQRILGREVFYLLESGVISAEDLDLAVRTSLAPRMQVLGVVQRCDYTGLNLSLRNLQDTDFVDAPVDPEPSILKSLVDEGHLGVTTGKGFYDYQGRSTLTLQRERDIKLWQVMQGLGDLVSDPKPI